MFGFICWARWTVSENPLTIARAYLTIIVKPALVIYYPYFLTLWVKAFTAMLVLQELSVIIFNAHPYLRITHAILTVITNPIALLPTLTLAPAYRYSIAPNIIVIKGQALIHTAAVVTIPVPSITAIPAPFIPTPFVFAIPIVFKLLSTVSLFASPIGSCQLLSCAAEAARYICRSNSGCLRGPATETPADTTC